MFFIGSCMHAQMQHLLSISQIAHVLTEAKSGMVGNKVVTNVM